MILLDKMKEKMLIVKMAQLKVNWKGKMLDLQLDVLLGLDLGEK